MPPLRPRLVTDPSPAPEPSAAGAVPELEDNGTFSNVMRWISRPGYAVRSALRGEFGDAIENAIQFATDSPIMGLGFIDRRMNVPMNLAAHAGIGPQSRDLTTREERPEFTDVLESWGAPTPTSTAGRLATDIIGGILTDPLTYLTLGTGGVAKGGLTGISRGMAGARVARALEETGAGVAALGQAERQVVHELARRPGQVGRFLRTLGDEVTPEVLDSAQVTSAAAEAGLSGSRLGALRRGIRTRAAERVMGEALSRAPGGAELGTELAARAAREALPGAARETVEDAARGLDRLGRRRLGLPGDQLEAAAGVVDGATDAARLGPSAGFARRTIAGVDEAGRLERFTGHAAQGDLLDAGLRALEQQGLTHTRGALRLEVPFTKLSTGPLVENVWPKLGGITAPGLARQALHQASPVVGQVVDEAARRAWDWTKGRLFSRRLLGQVPEGLRDTVREAAGVTARREAEARDLRAGLFGGLPVGASHVMGRQLIEAGEGLRRMRAQGLDTAGIERLLDEDMAALGLGRIAEATPDVARSLLAAAESRLGAVQGRELPQLREAVEHATRELDRSRAREGVASFAVDVARRTGDPAAVDAAAHSVLSVGEAQRRLDGALDALKRAEGRAARRGDAVAELRVGGKALALATQRMKLALAERGLEVDPAAVDRAVAGYVDAMTKVPAELERLGVWKSRDVPADLLYVPNQASEALSRFMAEGAHDPRYLAGLRDAFTKAREFKTHGEFVEHLADVARAHNVPIPEGVGDDLARGVQELDLGELLERRLVAHARTVERASISQVARKRFGMKPGDPADAYVRAQFEAANVREGVFQKVIGGGTFKIPLPSEEAVAAARKQGLPIGPGDAPGSKAALWKWEGLNAWYKPALTTGLVVPFPSFVARNVTSSMLMGMFDRDIGPAGAWAFFKGMTEAPLVRALSPNAPNDVAKILRAVREPANAGAQKALEGVKVGTYTGAEVVKLARQGVVTGSTFAERELFEGFRSWPLLASRAGRQELERLASTLEGKELLSRMPPRRVQLLRAAVRFPAAVSSHVEDSFRLGSFMALVRKGVDPVEASRRVSRGVRGLRGPVDDRTHDPRLDPVRPVHDWVGAGHDPRRGAAAARVHAVRVHDARGGARGRGRARGVPARAGPQSRRGPARPRSRGEPRLPHGSGLAVRDRGGRALARPSPDRGVGRLGPSRDRRRLDAAPARAARGGHRDQLPLRGAAWLHAPRAAMVP